MISTKKAQMTITSLTGMKVCGTFHLKNVLHEISFFTRENVKEFGGLFMKNYGTVNDITGAC